MPAVTENTTDELQAMAALPPERDEDGVPICQVHVCRMTARSSGPKGGRKAYYGCPVTGCDERNSKIRDTKDQWPKGPCTCPKCQTPMEYDKDFAERLRGINRARLPMLCPKCGRTCEIQDPRLGEMYKTSQQRRHERDEKYGERS